MSEAWREAARLGQTGERYPHVLADTHGWCLRLGPRDRSDNKYYSSLSSLLQGLIEHLMRRRLGAGEEIRTLSEFRDLGLEHLKQASALGEELDRQLRGSVHQQLQEGTDTGSTPPKSTNLPFGSGIGAAASEAGSAAA